jgi:hypothetical protein
VSAPFIWDKLQRAADYVSKEYPPDQMPLFDAAAPTETE